jgi:hypothetical protein
MDFRLYLLKEGPSTYEKSDLITYFKSNSNITSQMEGDNRVFTFHHPILNFEARFVMTSISCVPRLERLDPKYFDVNFMLEFNILLPTYSAELVFDIVEDLVKIFKFYVYNEAYQDVVPFRRSFMIKTFESWKRAYKDDNEDEIAKYNRLDPQTLTQVYNYLLRQKKLELFLDSKIVISNYYFLHTERSRTAFVAIKWDGQSEFILPPAVDILYLDDGKFKQYYPMSEVLQKTDKLFKPIDGYGVIQLMDAKNLKKFHKVLTKDKFAPLTAELKFLSMENILDI